MTYSHSTLPQWQLQTSLHSNTEEQPDFLPTPSPTSGGNMISLIRGAIRKTKSTHSRKSHNSMDDRDALGPPAISRSPSPVSPISATSVELPASFAAPQPERSPLLNPSAPTRRPPRAGMNAFTTPSNEPPPAYTPSPTAASGPTLGPSPAYTPEMASTPEDRYSFLTLFDTVLLIDDSGSMAGRSWRETGAALSALLPTIVSRDEDGIDLFFLNHQSRDPGSPSTGIAAGGYRNVTSPAEVKSIFSAVRPSGGTPTGTRCRALLKPYLARLEEQNKRGLMDTVKPLNIIVITDGVPSDDVESVLLASAKKLDALEAAPHQIGVQFFQVGNEAGAAAALKELDDDIAGLVRGGVRDMVDTCTWTGGAVEEGAAPRLTADGILKVCLGSVVKRLDRRRPSQEEQR